MSDHEDVDRWIAHLEKCKPLTEGEVEQLCEKVCVFFFVCFVCFCCFFWGKGGGGFGGWMFFGDVFVFFLRKGGEELFVGGRVAGRGVVIFYL